MFENVGQIAKAEKYQDKLDELTQEWGRTVKELIELRKDLIPKRSALLISAKNGVEIDGKVYKPSNKEEREALVDYELSDLIIKEENLNDKISYLDGASKNMRQLLSSCQSQMRVDGLIADALGKNQL